MTDLLEGKVAFVTGAARGQGRTHAVRLAEEGADIIAVDVCAQVESVPYPMAAEADLQQTAAEVEATGRRVFTYTADVRDVDALGRALDNGVAELGRLDIVCANAGIFSIGEAHELSQASWNDMIDINLMGAWHTVKVALPHLTQPTGGSIILTSSANGVVPAYGYAHYIAAKHGVIGLAKTLALELAPRQIRVNAVLPGGVYTDMTSGFRDMSRQSIKYAPDTPPVTDIPWLDPVDISNVVVLLASDLSKYVTGAPIPVMGMGIKFAERMGNAVTAGAAGNGGG